jgi:hypothetical protein
MLDVYALTGSVLPEDDRLSSLKSMKYMSVLRNEDVRLISLCN